MNNEEKYLDLLEKYQENTEHLIDVISKNMNGEDLLKEYSMEERRKAAYALNLCTVSVSQIIDYSDLIILEQEYEMILNNLNLENVPKDEALLNILKQILDTITFFRIEAGDKAIIDKEYEQRMKNAIWSAVPNFGLIVAGGNPITMGVSIASQLGIGFMNYRKNKAEYQLEHQKNYWQLQRAAIEQLNGLRRELFDAAWRLADEYNFPDEYRLTEKQITLYNQILLDRDPVRKYERLDAIKDKFKAYAPFWYFFGNSLLQIAEETTADEDVKNLYRTKAMECYDEFFKINSMQLLREDQLAASCAIEYSELLSLSDNVEKIEELIQIAERNSGGSFDILQLCAIQYLRIGNNERAKVLLKRLVNEDYNTVLNAQVLSNMYVSDYIYSRNPKEAQLAYDLLTKRVDRQYLFKLPDDETFSTQEIDSSFYRQQRENLLERYHYVLKQYIEKYTVRYNKLFPMPKDILTYSDSYFLDEEITREQRIEELKAYLAIPKGKAEYCAKLRDSLIPTDFLALINNMYNDLMELDVFSDQFLLETPLTYSIVGTFKDCVVNCIEEALNTEAMNVDLEPMISLSFRDLVIDFYKEVDNQLRSYVLECKNMNDFATATYSLHQFCEKYDLKDLENRLDVVSNSQDVQPVKNIFSSKLLGEGYERECKKQEENNRINEILDAYKSKITKNNKVEIKLKGTAIFTNYLNKMKAVELRDTTFAIIDAKSEMDVDLIFTTKGVLNVKRNLASDLISYASLSIEDNSIVKALNERTMEDYLEQIDTVSTLSAVGIATDAALSILNPVGLIAKKGAEIGFAKGTKKAIEGIKPFRYDNKNVDINELYSMICELKNVFVSSEETEEYGKSIYSFLNTPLYEK